MKLHKVETGNFKLDGGAMFGVVPKSLWNTVYPADENNMCNLSMRCLLIETEHKLILIDTGIGNKQDDKFFKHYYLNGEDTLKKSLSKLKITPEDITDVLITHLHFDHVGGAVSKNGDDYSLTFPNATHWVSGPQWKWAMEPNQREKASYLTENIQPLDQSGKLRFIDTEIAFTKDIQLRFFNGHTEGLIVPFIASKNYTLVYVSDLIPTAAHIPLSWVCGYDTRPLVSMEERKTFLESAFRNNYILFFEHDIDNECCTLKKTEKGIRVDRTFSLDELFTE